jgi:hypothetical protein
MPAQGYILQVLWISTCQPSLSLVDVCLSPRFSGDYISQILKHVSCKDTSWVQALPDYTCIELSMKGYYILVLVHSGTMWRDKLHVKKLVLKGWAPCTPKNMCWEHVPGSGKSCPRCLASVKGGGLVLCRWIMYEKTNYLWQSSFAFIIQWDLASCSTNLSFLLLVPGSPYVGDDGKQL